MDIPVSNFTQFSASLEHEILQVKAVNALVDLHRHQDAYYRIRMSISRWLLLNSNPSKRVS